MQIITIKTDMLEYHKILDKMRESYCRRFYALNKTLKIYFTVSFLVILLIIFRNKQNDK